MVALACAQGVRFAWVGVDGGYRKEPAFLRALDVAKELFVADVHSTQRVWTKTPGLHIPQSKPGRGRPAKKQQASSAPVAMDNLVKGFGSRDWTRRVLRDSTRGQLQVDTAHRRVWIWDSEEAALRHWHLIVRRDVGSPKTIKYSLPNAPADTPPPRLARMQGQRYWVERSLQDAKSECGMADYQDRPWPAWHHHMAMVKIAMLFMAEERTIQQDTDTLLSCADIVVLLRHFLPQAAVTQEQVIKQMLRRHYRRNAAIRSSFYRQRTRQE